MMLTVLARELRLTGRKASGALLSLAFFALFILLSGLALGGARPQLAPGLIWLALTLSALLSLDTLYRADQETGALRHMHLAGVSGSAIAIAKAAAFLLTVCVPLIAATAILAPLLSMTPRLTMGVMMSLIIGAPALAVYAGFTAALLCAQRGANILGVIITAPLLVPILLFGIEAAQSFPEAGLGTLQFRILAGLSCIASALGVPATMAALAANRGPV